MRDVKRTELHLEYSCPFVFLVACPRLNVLCRLRTIEDTLTAEQRKAKVEAMFRQYGRGVGSFVLARVGDADVAEAITSNVFLIVVRQIEQCRTSPAAWLWSICAQRDRPAFSLAPFDG